MADIYSQEKRSEIMSRIGASDTEPEQRVRAALEYLGASYDTNREDLPGTPDIVLPDQRVAVFVHGCFWHQHDCSKGSRPKSNKSFWNSKLDANVERDRRVRRSLVEDGWDVLVVWECQTTDADSLTAQLKTELPITD